jgi:hypothetical protein
MEDSIVLTKCAAGFPRPELRVQDVHPDVLRFHRIGSRRKPAAVRWRLPSPLARELRWLGSGAQAGPPNDIAPVVHGPRRQPAEVQSLEVEFC